MFRRKKQKKNESSQNTSDGIPLSIPSDFYSGSPTEQPLHENHQNTNTREVRKTSRHQKVMGKRKERGDLRDKAALLGILRLIIGALLLLIAFFTLKKGIGFYETSRITKDLEKSSSMKEQTSIMQAVELIKNFDIQNPNTRKLFSKRVESWKEADRLVRTADVLLLHNIYDQAIAQCQDALKIDPSHQGALKRLGELYFAKKNYINAINIYIRLMSVDPSQKEIQKNLIQALDAYGDDKAVTYMATWYFDQNTYDPDIQHYLANALFDQEKFDEAITAFNLVLRDSPENVSAMERLATIYIQTKQYEKALDLLQTLRQKNYRNPIYYKQIVICNAQLGRGKETVDTLGRAAQLFGEQMTLKLIQDPQLDPVRDNAAFRSFADRVGGVEFRLWLEKMASDIHKRKDDDDQGAPTLQLNMPNVKQNDSELLKLKN